MKQHDQNVAIPIPYEDEPEHNSSGFCANLAKSLMPMRTASTEAKRWEGGDMREFLMNGATPIQVHDDEFSNGFEYGYMHCRADFLLSAIQVTDDLLCTIITQTPPRIRCTEHRYAGYLAGFFTALTEKEQKHPKFQVRGKIIVLETASTSEIGGSDE
jgi:hypothetical protein